MDKKGKAEDQREDSSRQELANRLMDRMEERRIEKIVNEAVEAGIDVDSLTEEELSELFGFGRRKARKAASATALSQATGGPKPKSNQSRKTTAPRKPATAGPTINPATGTPLSDTKARRRRPSPPKSGSMGKKGTINPATGTMNTSTELLRGSRLALAERVASAFNEVQDTEFSTRKHRRAANFTKRMNSDRANGDKKVKDAQGYNDERQRRVSQFTGKQKGQTSTTAYNGKAGDAAAITDGDSRANLNSRGTSTVNQEEKAKNAQDAASGRTRRSMEREIKRDNAARRAKKIAKG